MDDNKDLRKLRKEEEELEKKIDNLTKKERGYGRFTEKEIISPDITPVKLDSFGINNVVSIQDTLFNLRGKDKYSKNKINDLIYADLYSDKVNRKEIELLMRNRLRRNTEFNYILNNMVEMQQAIDQLADDVVFPNTALQSGISLEFVGNNKDVSGERDEDLEKYFRPMKDITAAIRSRRIYNFDIETEVKELVRNLATYGYQIAATIPYKSIVTDLLYDADKMKKELNEKVSMVSEGESTGYYTNDVRGFSESFHDMYNFKNTNGRETLPVGEFFMNDLDYFCKHAHEINEIISTTPYTETDVDNVLQYIKEDSSLFSSNYSTNLKGMVASTDTIMDIIKSSPSGENVDPTRGLEHVLEDLKKKKNKKFIIDNIKGSTFEFLDINKVQPIFIKDQLIGAYVVDVIPDESRFRLGGVLSNIINASNVDDGIALGDTYKQKIKTVVLKDVETILRRNIDKTFLRNNPNLIEDIEWILEDNGIDKIMESRIRFIPAEYLTLFKIGKGPLGQSLLDKSKVYALMHIQLNKAEALAKTFLNKQRYKVVVNDTGNISSGTTIAQAVLSARNSIPRLTDVGIPDVMTDSLLANYQTVLTHMNPDGKFAVDIQTMDLMEPRDNSDYLRYLRNQATLPIGYPADVLDPSQNMDFAKKISNINQYTLIKVISMQNNITLPLSELCTKRIKYMTGNSNLEVKVTFNRPKDINDDITIEALDKVMRMIESYEVLVDNNIAIKPEEKTAVKAKIAKELLGEYIDMDIMNDMLDNVIVEGNEL